MYYRCINCHITYNADEVPFTFTKDGKGFFICSKCERNDLSKVTQLLTNKEK